MKTFFTMAFLRLFIILVWILSSPLIIISFLISILCFVFCLITYPIVWILTGKDGEYIFRACVSPMGFVLDQLCIFSYWCLGKERPWWL